MRILALICFMLLFGGAASADTQTVLWQETITAYGREIVIDVEIEVPMDVQPGIYRVRTVSVSDSQGESPRRMQPEKRRGIAYRTKPEEAVAVSAIDRTYHANGNPVSAGEALDAVQAFLAPVLMQVQDVELRLDELTVRSPRFIYNKDTGEWGEQVHPDETGSYVFETSLWLDGLPVEPRKYPHWLDSRKYPFGTVFPQTPYWNSYLSVSENNHRMMDVSMPTVIERTEERVELAPFEATKASLRALAERGLLRSILKIRMAYAAFDCGEEDVWELRPVWMTEAEIYWDETKTADDTGYEPWYETVMTDVRTGEIIELRWADGYVPPAEDRAK